MLFLSKARINILDDDTECVNSKWVNQIVDSVFGNDKLCCFCPRPESTFWTMTQNASTQNLKFPILLFHINKVGARINKMGHHFNKMGARINKMGHSESTKCGAPTICGLSLLLFRRSAGRVHAIRHVWYICIPLVNHQVSKLDPSPSGFFSRCSACRLLRTQRLPNKGSQILDN